MVIHRTAALCLLAFVASAAPPAAGQRDTRLAAAVQQLDGATVLKLLEQRVDVNAAQADGMTALLWAAHHDDLSLVDRLLRAGADVRAANRYGVTALSLACTNGNVAMVERLLGAGADPNSSLPGGETALMTAARTGRLGVVKALVARGADVRANEGRRGQHALMWAAAEGHEDVVTTLIEAGADFRTPLDSGFTPLLFAVREGRMGVVRALLKAGANVNETVASAASRSRPLPGGPPISAGASALLVAVTNAHFELAAMLLDAGADPNANLPGYTPLHAMASVRNPGVGDNDPAPRGSGTMSSLELVRRLAARGANLNARMTKRRNLSNTSFNELGATPFELAALTADTALMKTLVELGANPSLTNDDKSTPLMAAAGLGTRSPGEDAGTEDEVLAAVRLLLDLGADLNAVDVHGETAVHGAAYKNLPRVVEYLVERGATIDVWNKKNEFGWTPLTIARGYRFGNFKPSPETVAAIERVMLAVGVRPPTEKEEQAKGFDIYAKPPARTPPR